jgi:hypothetical protein
MPYHHKTSETFAEFTLRDRGPEGHESLTVEIESPFDESFKNDLKDALPWHARWWDGGANRWRVEPMFKDAAVRVAKEHFGHVFWVEGETVTDLVTGAKIPTPQGFDWGED